MGHATHMSATSWDCGALSRRGTRIALAIGVASVLGLADLWLTVHFMQTTGMNELNPIARAMVGLSPAALVCYKLLCMLVNGLILTALRGRPSAELAAWACVALMVALTAHWHQYAGGAHEVASMDPAMLAADPTFVKIGG